MNHLLVQSLGGIVARLRTKREAVQVGVKDGLAKDAMFPEDQGSIEARQKRLDLALHRQQLLIQRRGNISIASIVIDRNNKRVTRHEWGMVGNDTKGRCLFEHIVSDAAPLTKRAIGLNGTGIRGDIAPTLHANTP